MQNCKINFNHKTRIISINRTNVSATNRPDTRYINLTVGKRALINILLKRGWKLIVKFTQFLESHYKSRNIPEYSIVKTVKSLILLGLRTTTKSGTKYYRNKLECLDSKTINLRKDILKVGSFCTGAGSTPTALKDLNINFDLEYSCEIEKHPKSTLEHNFDVKKQFGDLFNVDASQLPYVDMLTAGFPCQTFSLSGKQAGFNDRRGTVIFKLNTIFTDLISQNKAPKIIKLENVKNLISHDKKGGEYDSLYGYDFDKKIGHTLHIIETKVLKPLSKYYDISWSIENTAQYGLPHNRERWFCILTLKTSNYSFNFLNMRNKKVPLTTCIKDYLEPENMVDSSYYYTKHKLIKETYANKGFIKRIGSLEGVSYSQSKRVLSVDGSASCMTCGENSKYLMDNERLRYLTVTERLRLQGYPTWYSFPSSVPKGARLKMMGNTMSINITKVMFEVLFNQLKRESNDINYVPTVKKLVA